MSPVTVRDIERAVATGSRLSGPRSGTACGLLAGDPDAQVTGSSSHSTRLEAIERRVGGANVLVTHHPPS